MSRATIWSVMVFVVFAFATLVIFFWIRDGSLREAGASMDGLLSNTGDQVSDTTGDAIRRATDGDERT